MTSPNGATAPAVELAQLRETLATRPVIEQAKGMIMLLHQCTSEQAFATLREISQHLNVKLRGVAAVIVAAGSRVEQPAQTEVEDGFTVTAVLAELRRRVPGIVPGNVRDSSAGVGEQADTVLPRGVACAPGEHSGAEG